MISRNLFFYLRSLLGRVIGIPANRFHPLVWINGDPVIGSGVFIGGFSEVNARGASVQIGDNCDIASFVSINCADSHLRCIGFGLEISRRDVVIGDNVFIGSHSVVMGGARIGHHSVIGAGSVVGPINAPPYSLIVGSPAIVKPGYYLSSRFSSSDTP